MGDFNPLPPHGGRRSGTCDSQQDRLISIHSLRMEGDGIRHFRKRRSEYFNPLPPHGGRLCHLLPILSHLLFQSTPSAWRETSPPQCDTRRKQFQSTPSAWRETQLANTIVQVTIFQSTPSAWRETGSFHNFRFRHEISIHSLRMEGDVVSGQNAEGNTISIHSLRMEGDEAIGYDLNVILHFNPLPPHGGRQAGQDVSVF